MNATVNAVYQAAVAKHAAEDAFAEACYVADRADARDRFAHSEGDSEERKEAKDDAYDRARSVANDQCVERKRRAKRDYEEAAARYGF